MKPVAAVLETAVAHRDCFLLPQGIVAPPAPFGQPMPMTVVFQGQAVVLTGTPAGCSGTRGQASVEYISGMAFEVLVFMFRDPIRLQAYANILPRLYLLHALAHFLESVLRFLE